MCLVCLALALVLWLIRLAGLPVFGEPEKRRLDALARSGDTVQVRGQIQDYEIKDNSENYLIKSCVLTVQENEIPVKKLYLITQQEEMLTIGSSVTAEGTLEKTEEPVNPGQFDAAAWYAAKGVFYTMWADNIRPVRRAEPGVRENMKRLRKEMAARLSGMVTQEQAGILGAMILGDKSLLDQETRSAYQTGGVLHVLSISGLHLTMLGMGLFRLLQKTGCPRVVGSAAAVAAMAVYTVFTGNGVATVRAFLMFAVMVAAGLLGRTYDSMSALALAAVMTLALQPENLYYSGFLLSYTAVLGAALVWPVWRKQIRSVRKDGEKRTEKEKKTVSAWEKRVRQLSGMLKENTMACTAITLTTLPLTAVFFCEIPVFSIIPNLVILPTMPWVMGSGILGTAAGMFSVRIGRILLLPATFLLGIYGKITDAVLRLPCAVWICGQPSFFQVLLFYLLSAAALFCFWWVHQEKNRGKQKARFAASGRGGALCAGIVAFAVFLLGFRWNPPLAVTALDVGQGDCLVIRLGGRHTWMIDAGSTDQKNIGNYRVIPYLKSQGISSLDGVFVTHSDEDHVNGVREILELSGRKMTAVRIRRLFLPVWMRGSDCGSELEQLAQKSGTDVQYVKRGDILKGDDFTMEILHPDQENYQENPNAGSIVISLKYREFDALFAGDLEGEGEKKVTRLLEKRGQRYEYLKVAHHGSENSTSEEFLETAAPAAGVISCASSGRYGHPHRELVERLRAAGTDFYVTAAQGAVTCVTDGRRYRIRGYTDTVRNQTVQEKNKENRE